MKNNNQQMNDKFIQVNLTKEHIEVIIEILSLAPYYKVVDIIPRLIYALNEYTQQHEQQLLS